jgi:hypothetical protein
MSNNRENASELLVRVEEEAKQETSRRQDGSRDFTYQKIVFLSFQRRGALTAVTIGNGKRT